MTRASNNLALFDQEDVAVADIINFSEADLALPVSARLAAVNWDFTERVAHSGIEGLHPYPAKFVTELPRALLHILPVPTGTAVLDPFCGKWGTTLVFQNVSVWVFPSFGIDLNPIACLMARVKTTPLSCRTRGFNK